MMQQPSYLEKIGISRLLVRLIVERRMNYATKHLNPKG